MRFKKDSFYIEKVLNGNASAYTYLVNKHKNMAFTIANKIIRNREDAEEIAQDAFLKVFHSLNTFKQDSKFSTWLYRIVYNTAISKTRKKKLQTTPLENKLIENFTIDEIKEDVKQLDYDEQKKIINNAIKKLTEEESLIITLFYMEGSSVEEISEITNLSKSNVKVKLHRIRKKLYIELQELLKNELKENYK
ncbi:MAG: sigma-70 family RNA polymerase sigma factor [Bacteroidales bacterium]|nr:sigma-70 family RNA polymerase sigma factor [Bacteroidales bacterium]